MADRVLMPRALDTNGDIVSGAVAYFFETGTTTPLTVYSDSDAITELGVSTSADATGTFPAVYTTQTLRMDIQDGFGVSLPGFPSDSWYIVPANGVGASVITFEPVEGNPATTVQTAIENLTALWVAVTTYGRTLIAATDAAAARVVLGLGTAATTASTVYATAAQGTKADAALPAASYGIKAHGTMNGTGAPAWLEQTGFGAITDNGVGDYTVTFSTAQPNANYQVMLSCCGVADAAPGNANRVIVNVKTDAGGVVLKSTTQVRLTTVVGATGTLVDVDQIYITIIGN